ncbi:glutathione peroxidase-family protein [Arthrobacter sp. V4I6]|nr:glutathione peroxidase-family protein [Arthrobacter sp. V1I7]MDQ0852534.1 glutathione peroxidase-family protein [Arthrobacter sp. V4I6]
MTFPPITKADVHGKNQHPLSAELTKCKNGVLPGQVRWNVEKFLVVNRDGEVVARLAPTVEPDSPELSRRSSLSVPDGRRGRRQSLSARPLLITGDKGPYPSEF